MTVARKKSPYENPSFTDESVEEMIKFLLVSILYGIFSYTNRGLRVNFDVIRGPRPFRSPFVSIRSKQKTLVEKVVVTPERMMKILVRFIPQGKQVTV